MAAPTFFGVATAPADNGSATEPSTQTLTPPASMTTGDLCVIFAYAENAASGDITMPTTGGQTWTTDATNGSYEWAGVAALSKMYWCTFDGTWTADPQIAFAAQSGTRGVGCQMLVFRPDVTTKSWFVGTGVNWTAFTAPSTPFTVSITGPTPVNNDTVTLARWFSDDDNTWDTLTGSGWSQTGLSAQYRNTGGSDFSATYAYYLQGSSPVDTGTVSQNQATLGGDAGTTTTIVFYAAAGAPQTLTQTSTLKDEDTFFASLNSIFTLRQGNIFTDADTFLADAKIVMYLTQSATLVDEDTFFATIKSVFTLSQTATIVDVDTIEPHEIILANTTRRIFIT